MLPLTLAEIIVCAKKCFNAGADGLHLHLRDKDGKHILDAGLYSETVQELATAVPGMAVQITTEAAGIYEPAKQMQVALNSNATLVSASVRELTRLPDQKQIRNFYQDAAGRGIAIQHILYDISDLTLLRQTLPEQLYQNDCLQLIFVLGKYGETDSSAPQMLDVFLDQICRDDIAPDWGVCAFGFAETQCLIRAHQQGGKLRLGFENSFYHSDKSLALDNSDRVAAVCAAIS